MLPISGLAGLAGRPRTGGAPTFELNRQQDIPGSSSRAPAAPRGQSGSERGLGERSLVGHLIMSISTASWPGKRALRHHLLATAGIAGALLLEAAALRADAAPAAASHVTAAKAAAGTRWEGLFNTLCEAPSESGSKSPSPAALTAHSPAPPPAGPPPAGSPEQTKWYAPPAKVFDNLYYVGMSEYSAWAVTTSAGIILIDTIFDYSIEPEVVDGLSKLGLDPKTIKYAIVSHGHGDHSGGAKYLQDKFGTKIVLSADDWELIERNGGTKPKRDIVATDGMALTLGDTTLRLYVTPGHTLGTISTVIPLRDRGQPHVAVTWGGTAFNWLKHPDQYITPERSEAFWFRHYAESATRFAEIAARAHADVILSNHTVFDGSKKNLPLLSKRGPDQANPYVVGAAGVRDYLTVASECARAGLERLRRSARGGV
jgi:metallo-beta-lactamase class B